MYNSCFNWMSVLCDGNRLVLEILLSSILFRVHVNFQSDYWLITVYCLHVLTANNTRSLISEWMNFILSFPKRYNECLLFLLFSHKVNAQVQEYNFPLYSMSRGYFYIAERLYLGVGCGGGLRPLGGNKPILDYISIKSTLD